MVSVLSRYTLRPYQERAVQEAIESPARYEVFDMGLGKTLIMLDYLKRTGKKALVVAPLLVATRTWPMEIEKFTPELSYTVLHGKDKNDLRRQKSDIMIINFEGLKWYKEQIDNFGSVDLKERVLIIDEATMIKNPGSVRFKALKALRHFFKPNGIFCLSGEPMPSSYKDLWAPYYMIDGGVALESSFSRFRSKYFYESGPPRWLVYLKPGAQEAIQEQVKPLTSVLRAADHLEMPESIFIEVKVDLPKEARKTYEEFKREYALEFGELNLNVDNAAIQSGKLRQLTQGAIYGEDKQPIFFHDSKSQALKQLVDEAQGAPILCPIYFSFEVKYIREALGYDVPVIAGGTSQKEKQRLLNLWDKKELPLLLCQPASLSHGLNMQTGGNIIVWYGRPWSLEQYNQLNGRLIRPGQMKSVLVYYITAANTADEKVALVLASKAATQEQFKQAVISDFQS